MRLSDDERSYLLKEIHKNEKLLLFINNIISKRLLDVSPLQIDDQNWIVKRAYKDGQACELIWLKKLMLQLTAA